MSGRLTELDIEETSGVDYPAHLADGWLMLKGRDMGNPAVDRLAELLKAATVTCEKCGEQVDGSAEHCSKCGAVLPKSGDDVEKSKRLTTGRVERLRTIRDGIDAIIGEAGGNDVSEHENDAPVEDELLKALPDEVRAVIEKRDETIAALQKQTAEDREELRKERIEKADREAIEKARGWSNLPVNPEEFGPQLRELRQDKPELAKAVEDIFDAAEAEAKSAALFTNVGKGRASEGSPSGQLQAMAKAVASEKNISEAEAMDQVLQTEEGNRLYEADRRERAGR